MNRIQWYVVYQIWQHLKLIIFKQKPCFLQKYQCIIIWVVHLLLSCSFVVTTNLKKKTIKKGKWRLYLRNTLRTWAQTGTLHYDSTPTASMIDYFRI